MNNYDTICAISTPSGVGGIAVIRVSGDEAVSICDKIFISQNGKKLSETDANKVIFGKIIAPTPTLPTREGVSPLSCGLGERSIAEQTDRCIDEVLVTVFRAPHSFTGEDTVEISCHGSLYVQQEILQMLLANGASLAQAGEFTQRAFLNGKMDLTQAEAVADLIASTHAAAHRLAMRQMRGGFSAKLAELRAKLVHFASLIELELDFSEEDVEFADRTQVKEFAVRILDVMQQLADSFRLGNAVKNGIPVAIVGETNAGKSTLLNSLFNEDKAIVSDIHGTTRDAIEDVLNLRGRVFRFIDTAGIRKTKDYIESIGISRTYKKMEQASIVLWMFDAQQSIYDVMRMQRRIYMLTESEKILPIANKCDLITDVKRKQIQEKIHDIVFLTAKNKEGIDTLIDILIAKSNISDIDTQEVVVTNLRHYEILTRAIVSIQKVISGLDTQLASDFLAQDIREAIYILGEITGEISNQDILTTIFEKFCIGK